ncbi:hypothetical protein [Streptomyces coffeae]|nr:hypothetical protein [Streptomyces coffeae]
MTTRALPWTPPIGVQLLPAGRWWDAVRVPVHLGDDALHLLGENTGAVIGDSLGRALWWLIKPGAAVHWDPLPSVKVYGDTAYVEVPSTERTAGPGVHWRVPPTAEHLTGAAALHFALQVASQDAEVARRRGRT